MAAEDGPASEARSRLREKARCGRPGHWKRECPMANNQIENVKKNNEGESFTGMMIEEFHMVRDNQGSSETVIHALPEDAQPYYVTGLEANTDRKSASATVVHEPDQPVLSGSTFLQSQMNSEAGGAEIFNTEEADDEAIIDTGASRAVIGLKRTGFVSRWCQVEVNQRVCLIRIMATEGTVNYLQKSLTSPVDPSLHGNATYQELPQSLSRPPGVANLEEWGSVIAPSGKHHQKTYAVIYETDRKYVSQMWNRRAVAPWARSFQLYCRHRREASIEKQKEDTINQGLQMPISPHMTPEVASLIRAGGAPWLTPRTNAQLIEQKKVRDAQKAKKEDKDWEHVEVTEVKTSKRSLPSTASTMETQPNETKVAQLQAQIATLQRDLQIELNGLKQIRSTGPAKMSLSIFGVPSGPSAESSSAAASEGPKLDQAIVPRCADHSIPYEPSDSEKVESKLGVDESVGVVAVEQKRVVWLSHLGRLVRASPEQIRPASLREFINLPRGEDNQVKNEEPKGRSFVDLSGDPEDFPPREGELEENEYSPGTPRDSTGDTSQPEQEDFRNDAPTEDGNPNDTEPVLPHEVPVPDWETDKEDSLFGDDVTISSPERGVWEINFTNEEWEPEVAETFCAHPGIFEQVWLTTGEKRKRVEVNYRLQSEGDQALFDAAKKKEIKAWIDHGTVQRATKGTLRPEQVMRCRWILTWKPPAPGTTERRAKARLVVLGFEDPDLQQIPNDAPTLSKDGRQLLLQQVASSVDWSNPGKILQMAPRANAVTDCKSVYDIATKTSTPTFLNNSSATAAWRRAKTLEPPFGKVSETSNLTFSRAEKLKLDVLRNPTRPSPSARAS
ncbi:unnamed protein product [Cladocopium goreaui]|uniref:Copia protein n=1 Tax=Cladocopium goreaui TaxID=2562237 RepID=A0A9P1DQC2_9DINO|nr:unnamed protein product [Cladocopium goreaui]